MDEPTGGGPLERPHLAYGLDLLDSWSARATQAQRNAVYRALFAVTEGAIFRTHDTVGGARDFSVLVNDGLVMRVRLEPSGAFGIVSLGVPAQFAWLDDLGRAA